MIEVVLYRVREIDILENKLLDLFIIFYLNVNIG